MRLKAHVNENVFLFFLFALKSTVRVFDEVSHVCVLAFYILSENGENKRKMLIKY